MSWRIQLAQPTIRRIDLLSGSRSVVAVWTQPDRVHFYDQRNGTLLSERVIEKLATADQHDERWQAFVNGLRAPNDVFLPYIRTSSVTILSTEDGRIRLYQRDAANVMVEVSGKDGPLPIEEGVRLMALDLDRSLGLVAALDTGGILHIYQQRVRVGSHNPHLTFDSEFTPVLTVTHGGRQVFLSDGHQVVVLDASGKLRKRLELHFPLGLLSISPDGSQMVLSDAETGVLRLYNTENLSPTHQRYAIDLAADTRRVNPAAGAQPASSTPSALALSSRGVLAFGLGSLLCVTSTAKMRALPTSSAR